MVTANPKKREVHSSTARLTVSLSALLCGLSVISCTPSSLVEQGIERELPKYVGPAERYDVKIEGFDASKGSADSVVAVGERVRPEGAPVIDRLALNLTGVVYDKQAERLSRVDNVSLTAVVKTPDLSDFLETYRNVREAEVTLQAPDRAMLRIRPQIDQFALPSGITVDVGGELVGRDTQLRFEVDSVSAAGIDVSAIAASRLSDAINPLADLKDLPVDVEIASVVAAGESIGMEVIGDPASFSPQ
ncbi:DUF2993 domain-containing protein [cf. Phormidesmis sp. LEGE 11477]|uniref:LmeA family phospholipid-binding protein n=1 Tax=cf. Phormidesmis sp. LEGE 11477 TaxID=1828680 RepID=UPI00188035AA|nr:DUF2993 domain-containing protein [cf. Phormidesmis sp. LEGE 11477]MBE9059713.1 DUF2993 domain-containing protein [cf. Phormidesmis sp. LEGE 11477]